ncbi:MAG: acetylpolyamine aminohydrolase [Pseudomonadota bacterium]
MKIFRPAFHHLHTPQLDLSDGLPGFPHLETAARLDGAVDGLARLGLRDTIDVPDLAKDDVAALHDADYIAFLEALSDSLAADEAYIPTQFDRRLSEAPIRVQGGLYCREIGTPINSGTLKAAYNSAATAVQAAQCTAEGNLDSFALCRPPGHHAGPMRYGGYCFFNNAYLAANVFAGRGQSVCVLDIDYHLGDGSAEFADPQIPYFSIHANVARSYPFITPDQSNSVHLIALPAHVDIRNYLALLEPMMQLIAQQAPDVLVVSLGFDLVNDDFIQDEVTALVAADYRAIGESVGSFASPVCCVLEGGYDRGAIASCCEAFFTGLRSVRT